MNTRNLAHAGMLTMAVALLAACGGGSSDSGNRQVAMMNASACTPSAFAASGAGGPCRARGASKEVHFSSVVSFGDSLSDVGTYAVGSVTALGGGGRFTVNSPGARVWVEDVADELDLRAPCAFQTGLNGISTPLDFNVPVTTHAGCTGYGEGGSRVTDPYGPGNPALGGNNVITGFLTVPVITQIQDHLQAVGGAFRGDEAVFVLVGANDASIHLGLVAAGAQTPQDAVMALGKAGAELAAYVRQMVLGNGARHVIVVNVPDLADTPRIRGYELASPGTQALVDAMITTFNAQLAGGLAGSDALIVDAYAASKDSFANPQKYGFTNVTLPACDLAAPTNPIGSSLMCNEGNLQPGLSPAAARTYEFSDGIHPTPFGHRVLAWTVLRAMERKGWL